MRRNRNRGPCAGLVLAGLLALPWLLGTPLPAVAAADRALERRPERVVDAEGRPVVLYAESHALIIGNATYTNGWSSLPGVRDDVTAVAEALKAQGFEVEVRTDLRDRAALRGALDAFVASHGQKADNRLLIYYAGHGHTRKLAYGGQMGYLVPVAAPDPNRDPSGFHAAAMSMEEIAVLARRIEAKHALFVFDSCFSGSVFTAARGVPDAIQAKTGQPVRQFITAGTADQPVPDQSIFRRQFVAALKGEARGNQPGYLTAAELGQFLETTVANYTHRSQTPVHGKLPDPYLDKGDFVFILPSAGLRPLDGPVAGADRWSDVIGGRTYRLPVLDNDSAAMGGGLRVASVAGVMAGRAEVSGDGTAILYTAPANGTEVSFTYRVREDGGGESEARVTLSFAAAPPPPGSVFKDCADCPEMVVVPGGRFQMGSSGEEPERYKDEGPRHWVSIPGAFGVGRYEVTFSEWDACVSAGGCNGYRPGDEGWGRGRRPVVNVSWTDAQAYVSWLSRKTGQRYRLLSESEWEYAARSGTDGPFSTGSTITPEQANFDGNGTYNGSSKGAYRGKTVAVGSFSANGFGLHDMHGNVWEWTEDCWHADYGGAPTDGSAWTTGTCDGRVPRGGSWNYNPWSLRSANRLHISPDNRFFNFGFRVARTVSP